MKKNIKIKIEDLGTFTLEYSNFNEYDVFNSNGICIGAFNVDEYGDWDGEDMMVLTEYLELFLEDNSIFEDTREFYDDEEF